MRNRIRLPTIKYFGKILLIGLHVILQIQIQIKKNQNCLISYVQNKFNRNTSLEVILNEF